MISFVLFSVFIILILCGAPIAVCLGVSSLVVLEHLAGTPNINMLAKSAIMGGNSFPLVAIPMFVLAGEIMQQGGLSRRIVSTAYGLVGRFKAGLAYVNVLACMFFAAISGSSPATVAAIGSTMIPEMEKHGYDKDFSAALTSAAGITGVMIPPSIPLIIYGVTANQSIGALFMAGIVPGVLFSIGFMLVSRIVLRNNLSIMKVSNNNSQKEQYQAQAQPNTKLNISIKINANTDRLAPKKGALREHSIWALIVPVIILGGIYGGIFTPTEAAGVAVIYALLISVFVYSDLKLKDLPNIFKKASLTSATVLVMVVMAAAFGRLLTLQKVPVLVANTISQFSDNPIVILLLINLMLLLVGMFMETIAAIIILTPILLPIAITLGIDPIHFGIIMTVNLAIGFCTPPLGANLFIASGIANVSIEKITVALWPFLIAMLVMLMLVSYIPSLSLFIPNLN
ncbi:C4-dicarboxylate transport system large permease component [Gammaproteobacteria bacterium]|nr:C4-dicarboxylate transport system large permease component [Gammaproteobacteria bacterium]